MCFVVGSKCLVVVIKCLVAYIIANNIKTAPKLVDFIVPLQITKGSREFYFGK